MNCPRCDTPMTKGAPHSEGDAYQHECHNCGKCIGVTVEYHHPHRIRATASPYDCGGNPTKDYPGE